uniref:Uncharacterized protein n=1 Tax=Proboscia inermis TaxID=420281 RepID=A0A7S0C7M2_9STRA
MAKNGVSNNADNNTNSQFIFIYTVLEDQASSIGPWGSLLSFGKHIYAQPPEMLRLDFFPVLGLSWSSCVVLSFSSPRRIFLRGSFFSFPTQDLSALYFHTFPTQYPVLAYSFLLLMDGARGQGCTRSIS